jgi:alpha-glucosidase (family GH31 glycosyl hydrolase)
MPELSRLFEHAAKTGEPILRPLAYHFPGSEAVKDQFLLGEEILCAPILEPEASTRCVVVPSGRWRDNDGSVTEGPAEIVLDVRLESLPFWRRIRD